MSSDLPDPDGQDPSDDALAAEYVLHLLGAVERTRFEDRLDVEGALRGRVDAWAERLVPIAEDVDPVAPPAHIRAALAHFAAGERAAPRRRGGVSLAQMLRGMLGGALVAAAAAVLLAVFLPMVEPPYSGPSYVADLAADDGSLAVQARFDPRGDVLRLSGLSVEPPAGRVLQLWLLPEGADAPLSLGLLPGESEVAVPLSPESAAGVPGGLLEISEEPPGGSPEAGPTGDVLAIGEVEEI